MIGSQQLRKGTRSLRPRCRFQLRSPRGRAKELLDRQASAEKASESIIQVFAMQLPPADLLIGVTPGVRNLVESGISQYGLRSAGSAHTGERIWHYWAGGESVYSEMMRSAHSTKKTKMAGLPSFAPQVVRSLSETPRAREQAAQEKTGMCLAKIFSRNSLSGGQPIGKIASDVALRIK